VHHTGNLIRECVDLVDQLARADEMIAVSEMRVADLNEEKPVYCATTGDPPLCPDSVLAACQQQEEERCEDKQPLKKGLYFESHMP
jgi:hypothetical protein